MPLTMSSALGVLLAIASIVVPLLSIWIAVVIHQIRRDVRELRDARGTDPTRGKPPVR